jgi:putative flippase GtrA
VRLLPQRLWTLAPEAAAFGVIGLANLGLYYVIFNALFFVGAVKSTVIATLVTTYLAYLANRHWTYKHRPRAAVRREYTLFFAVNLAGLLIQSAGTAVLKYGFNLSEAHNRLTFNIVTTGCICVATLFRFWTYRTFVFKDAPVPVPAGAVAAIPIPASAIPASREPVSALADAGPQLTPDEEFEQLAASLEAELGVEADSAEDDAARIH